MIPRDGEPVLTCRAMEGITVANQVRNAAFLGHSDTEDVADYHRHHCGCIVSIGFPPSWTGGSKVVGLAPGSGLELKVGMTFPAHSWFTNTEVVDYFVSNRLSPEPRHVSQCLHPPSHATSGGGEPRQFAARAVGGARRSGANATQTRLLGLGADGLAAGVRYWHAFGVQRIGVGQSRGTKAVG